MHSHVRFRDFGYALGVDLVIIGPQTNFDALQAGLHKQFTGPVPSDSVLALQIGNPFRPAAVGEIGRTFRLGQAVEVRPFGEVRAGDEMQLRVSTDLLIGLVGRGELFARESISGHRYQVIYQSQPGFRLTIAADIAYVAGSVHLPRIVDIL